MICNPGSGLSGSVAKMASSSRGFSWATRRACSGLSFPRRKASPEPEISIDKRRERNVSQFEDTLAQVRQEFVQRAGEPFRRVGEGRQSHGKLRRRLFHRREAIARRFSLFLRRVFRGGWRRFDVRFRPHALPAGRSGRCRSSFRRKRAVRIDCNNNGPDI
jgi:hypothetical protein